jgi:hypothetical protein
MEEMLLVVNGRKASHTYLWHNGLAILIFDVPEGHLRALVLVELDLRVVDVGDHAEGDY